MAVSFLFHFPSAFAAWGFPSVLPFGVRTFLGSALAARGHPACTQNGSAIATSEARNYGAPVVPVVDAGAVSRLVVIGDVHGNAVAFAAVLEEIRADPPDLVVVNGDLSWGAEPEATLAMADGLADALFVQRQRRVGALPSAARADSDDGDVDARAPQRRTRSRRSSRSLAPSPSTSRASAASSSATAHRAATRSS